LEDDEEREREALAGLASGEAYRLFRFIMFGQHKNYLREAAETAIGTAHKLFEDDFDADLGGAFDQNRYRSRRELKELSRREGRRRPGALIRRRSSFTYGEGVGGEFRGSRPIQAQLSGGGYALQQPTYVAAQPQYVVAPTGGMGYGRGTQPAYSGGGYVPQQQYGVPGQQQFGMTGAQPYQNPMITGQQPLQYAATPGAQYGALGGQPAFAGAGVQPQYMPAGGAGMYTGQSLTGGSGFGRTRRASVSTSGYAPAQYGYVR